MKKNATKKKHPDQNCLVFSFTIDSTATRKKGIEKKIRATATIKHQIGRVHRKQEKTTKIKLRTGA